MELLSVGELSKTVMKGQPPSTELVVQVLALKPLGGDVQKQRLKLWDGDNEYTHAVLDISSGCNPTLPSPYSIIKIDDMKIKKAGNNWATIIVQFSLLKEGAEVANRVGSQSRNIISNGTTSTPPAGPSTTTTPHPTPIKSNISQPPQPHVAQVKRNLEDSFNSTEAKRQSGEWVATHSVISITPYTNKYTIKVRVGQKGKLKQINTRNYCGSVIDCVLIDSTGSIKLTAWSKNSSGQDHAVALDEKLQEGSTYFVTGCAISVIKNANYNNTGHQYELTWTQLTRVFGPITDEVVNLNYKFVPLSQIHDLNVGDVVDVVGWVQNGGQVINFTSKNGRDLTKREILLADTNSTVTLTLWSDAAVNFDSHGRVLAVNGAKIQEFQGVKSIGIGFNGSYEVEPNVPGVAELVSWSLKQTAVAPVVQQTTDNLTDTENKGDFNCISNVQREVALGHGERKYTIRAMSTRINTDTLFYRAHNPSGDGPSKCRKKVQEVPGRMGVYVCRCSTSEVPENETILRYMVKLCLADWSTYEWAIMFEAESLFGMTAQELHELREANEDEFLKLVKRLQFTERLWSINAKVEAYQGENKVKFIVLETSPVNWQEGNHINQLWNEVVKLESEIGVSHEEEWAIDLSSVLKHINTQE